VLFCGGGGAAIWFLSIKPAIDKVRQKIDESADQIGPKMKFKQVGIGAHNLESAEGKFHAPYHIEPGSPVQNETPTDLTSRLSWRVSLLPFVEQAAVYSRIRRNEAWDSPANRPISLEPIFVYTDVTNPTDPSTRIRCFYGNGAMFDADPKKRTSIAGIKDGTSNTIMYAESADKVPWSQCNEIPFDPNGPLPSFGRPNSDKFFVTMADGSVRMVRKNVDPIVMKAAITKNGGEVMSTQLED